MKKIEYKRGMGVLLENLVSRNIRNGVVTSIAKDGSVNITSGKTKMVVDDQKSMPGNRLANGVMGSFRVWECAAEMALVRARRKRFHDAILALREALIITSFENDNEIVGKIEELSKLLGAKR